VGDIYLDKIITRIKVILKRFVPHPNKTFFLGLLRTKTAELQQEINVLKAETRNASEDQATFLSYEKR